MSVPAPHFLLYSEAARAPQRTGFAACRWRFALRLPGGETSLEAADDEPAASLERLELLAIVRGLEALDQRSRVTLVNASASVQQRLKFGLAHWRENDWQWERYGQMTPVKNSDLWQRLDRLLEIHAVECRPGRLKQTDDLAAAPQQGQWRRNRRGRLLRVDSAPSPIGQKQQRTREPKNQTGGEAAGSSVLRNFGSSVLRLFGL